MSPLLHNTGQDILCNKDDSQVVEVEQLTLDYVTTATNEDAVVEPAEQPPPAHAPPAKLRTTKKGAIILALPGQDTKVV